MSKLYFTDLSNGDTLVYNSLCLSKIKPFLDCTPISYLCITVFFDNSLSVDFTYSFRDFRLFGFSDKWLSTVIQSLKKQREYIDYVDVRYYADN